MPPGQKKRAAIFSSVHRSPLLVNLQDPHFSHFLSRFFRVSPPVQGTPSESTPPEPMLQITLFSCSRVCLFLLISRPAHPGSSPRPLPCTNVSNLFSRGLSPLCDSILAHCQNISILILFFFCIYHFISLKPTLAGPQIPGTDPSASNAGPVRAGFTPPPPGPGSSYPELFRRSAFPEP